jgi:hypothetical protein
MSQDIQERINRIRMESQVKFSVIEEYIEYRQQVSPQDARSNIVRKYGPQAEFILEIMGPKHEVPRMMDRFSQNLNNYCNEAEGLFFELAKMK